MIASLKDRAGLGERYSGRSFDCFEATSDYQTKALTAAREVYGVINQKLDLEQRLQKIGNRSFSDIDDEYLKEVSDLETQLRAINNTNTYGCMLIGSVGTGKTHLACAILNELVDKRNFGDVLFANVPEYLDRLRSGYDKGEYEKMLNRLLDAKILVLDDFCSEKTSEWSIEKIQTVVDKRYRDFMPTIITANYEYSQMGDLIGDRTISRIAEMCRIIELKGSDWRLIKAKGGAVGDSMRERKDIYG